MTDKDAEGCPYCQCSSLVFVPIDANYGERRCASCGAVHSVMQIEDHAELARLRAALAEADRERDEAARKIREHAEHVNYYGNLYSKTEVERRKLDEQREFYKDELAKAQVCADEMAALAWKWKYKADCQRETIRALVVAARAMWWALRHMGGHQPFFIGLVRSEAALLNRMGVTSEWEILERQREAERGQAGKGADNG